jgi:hypothetical protein
MSSLWGWYQCEEEEDIKKGCRRVKYCVYMYINRKMRPVETIPGMGIG